VLETAAGINRCDGVEIGRKQCRSFARWRALHETADAIAPFLGPARLRTLQIVKTRTRMGIDHAKRLRLFAQMHKNTCQRRVLENVCEISGMKNVAIVHAALSHD